MQPEIERRGPGRPRRDEVRSPLRTEGIRERKRKGGQLHNPFHIDASRIPEGTSYEWKRYTVYGKADPSYDILMREQGWEPVDASRHPELVADGHTSGAIIRDGLILMERPIELTREAQEEDLQAAREAIEVKKQQLGQTPAGTLPRDVHPAIKPSTRTTYESIPIE